MSCGRAWSNEQEVLRDLARATGRKVGGLDEGFLVIGTRPPPRHVIEQNDEVELMFGDTLNEKLARNDTKTPDLKGITEMLRMVNGFDEEEDEEENAIDSNVRQSDTVITISKLNPNVQEFVPKTAATTSLASNDNNGDIVNNTEVPNETEINDTGTNCISVNTSSQDKEKSEIKALADELKSKISEASKSDTYENKKRKNVAIATLLKLYATKTPSPTKKKVTNENTVKLMTPQDFECPKKNNSTTPDGTGDHVITAASDSHISVQSTSSSEKNAKTTVTSNSISSTPVQSEPNVKEISKTINGNTDILNPEVKASIDKVNKWLEKPVSKKSPSVFLGPVSFKRKDESVKSPISDSSQKVSKPSGTIAQYKPSNYAADLEKKYMERTATKEKVQKNAWTNLDEILKERDIEIRKRREKESSSNSQTSVTSTE